MYKLELLKEKLKEVNKLLSELEDEKIEVWLKKPVLTMDKIGKVNNHYYEIHARLVL